MQLNTRIPVVVTFRASPSPALDRCLCELVAHGLSIHQLAALLDTNAAAVRRHLARLSLSAPDWTPAPLRLAA